MKFIEFDRTKCDECYKCLRGCPTKAIAFAKDNHRKIIDDMCIKCGRCQESCPHGALTIQNDSLYIRKAMEAGRQMVVSLAPSFISAFELQYPEQIVTGLKKLGFHIVEETAEGAELVSWKYEEALEKNHLGNIITTCCPSATYLIEQYYPEHIPNMIPVVSPMIAHGRILKERYGSESYTVFIGPCLAKKAEAEELAGSINAVLTFNELAQWLDEEGIQLQTLEKGEFTNKSYQRGRAYPLGSSTRKRNLDARTDSPYKFMRVEGIDRCREMLSSLGRKTLSGYCIEMNICSGSCINGPDFPTRSGNYYERENRLHCYASQSAVASKPDQFETEDGIDIDYQRQFHDKSYHSPAATEEELERILNEMGKFSPKDQLNCGACGYSSCMEKATAVFAGISDIQMCLPYLRAKAENLRTTIFEHTPNLVCILDEELRILEVNPAFHRLFNSEHRIIKGFPIYAFLEETLFQKVAQTGEDIIGHKEYFKELDREFYMNIVSLKSEKVLVCTLTDVTADEKNRQELLRIKEQTVTACQDVINKQMRVAQEIASLLGETTAETKVNLNRLRDLVLRDEGGR